MIFLESVVNYELTKIGKEFIWTNEHSCAVEKLKACLTNCPILAHPSYDNPFVMHTDANLEGLGAELTQEINGQEYIHLSLEFNTLAKYYNQQKKMVCTRN